MSKLTLYDLYDRHTGKISDKWSLYLAEYDRLFAPMAEKQVRLLEIGIQNGGSLEIWSQYFRNAIAIIGCDINPDCEGLSYEDPKIHVVVGDASATATQEKVLKLAAQYDIIIDDGSHLSSDIAKSFALYFPHIVDGGIFIAEDLHCSYWERFEGGLYSPYSSIAFFKCLADVINHEHWGVSKPRGEVLRSIFSEYDFEISEEVLSCVHSIEFINSMCVVRKAPANENGLDRRVIAGTEDSIIPSNPEWNDLSYHLDPIFDETKNVWSDSPSSLPKKLTELVELLRHKDNALIDTKDRAARLEQQNDQLRRELEALHDSISWRVTAILRFAVRLGRQMLNLVKGGAGA